MKSTFFSVSALLAGASMTVAAPSPAAAAVAAVPNFSHNNFNCRSTTHPNPVVLLHGLFASEYLDLNFLEGYLQTQGFCTFGLTYGAYDAIPIIGGLKAIPDSAKQIADFILEVKQKTGAAKVDLVGHSEGGFQSLYVPKFEQGISAIVDKIVAIAPPTHGTDLSGVANILYIGGEASRDLLGKALEDFGCPACNDIAVGGSAVTQLTTGKIAQPGNKILVIASSNDHIVTPPTTAFINEPGVTNMWVQDRCPLDFVGHIGLAVDLNVWWDVHNWLDPSFRVPIVCIPGIPLRN